MIMKNFRYLLYAPLLAIVCTVLALLKKTGILVLLLMLFRDLCLPILHFVLTVRYADRSDIRKTPAFGISLAVLWASVLLYSVGLDAMLLHARSFFPFLAFRVGWSFLCAVLLWGNALLLSANPDSIPAKLILSSEAVLVLCVNAILTHTLSPFFAARYAFDGIEIVFLSVSFLLLCVFSCVLGSRIKKHRIPVLCLWTLGILSSAFIALWLLGTPHTPPTADPVSCGIWLLSSAAVLLCFVFGKKKTSV